MRNAGDPLNMAGGFAAYLHRPVNVLAHGFRFERVSWTWKTGQHASGFDMQVFAVFGETVTKDGWHPEDGVSSFAGHRTLTPDSRRPAWLGKLNQHVLVSQVSAGGASVLASRSHAFPFHPNGTPSSIHPGLQCPARRLDRSPRLHTLGLYHTQNILYFSLLYSPA